MQTPSWTVRNRDLIARFCCRWNRGLPTVYKWNGPLRNRSNVFWHRNLIWCTRCWAVSIAFVRCGSGRFSVLYIVCVFSTICTHAANHCVRAIVGVRFKLPMAVIALVKQLIIYITCGFSDVNPTVRFGFRTEVPFWGQINSNPNWFVPKTGVRFWNSFNVLRCGSVRFSEIVKPTVRFGAVFRMSWTLRCGTVWMAFLRCGSVRFSDIVEPTVRFPRGHNSNGAVRCG